MKYRVIMRSGHGSDADIEALYMKVEGSERPSYAFYAEVAGMNGTHPIAAFPVELVERVIPNLG